MRAVVCAILCLPLAACDLPEAKQVEYTRELQVNTIGTKVFEVRRTIDGRTVASPDAILTARGSLIAQTLCPSRFVIERFSVEDLPPTLSYEARIRCL